MTSPFHCDYGPTLGPSDHHLAKADVLPDACLHTAFYRIRTTSSAFSVIRVVLMQLEVLGHCYDSLDTHPGSEIVSSLWSRFSCLEQDKESLNCTQARHVHETVLMFYS